MQNCNFALFYSKIICLNKIFSGNFRFRVISYKRLWKLLIDKDIKKKDLVQMAGLSSYTLNKLNKGENVNAETLMKICVALDCSFDDIMEIVGE